MGRAARAAPRCSTARSWRWTPRASPAGFQRIQDRIHLTERARDRRARGGQPDRVRRVRSAARRRRGPVRAAARRAAPPPGGRAGARAGRRRSGCRRRCAATARRCWRRRARAAGRGWSSRTRARRTGPGGGSREWRKLKLVKRDSFVVGGFTEPRGARSRLRRAAARRARAGRPPALRRATSAAASRTHELDRVARAAGAAARSPNCPFDERPVDQREAALDAPGAGRRGAVPRRHRRRHPARADLPRPARRRRRGAVDGAESVTRCADAAPRRRGRVAGAAEKPPSRAAIARVRDQLDALARARQRAAAAARRRRAAGHEPRQAAVAAARHQRRATCFATTWTSRRYILPVVRDRPLVMQRLPDGVDGHVVLSSTGRPTTCPRACGAEAVPGDDVPMRLVGGDAHDAALHGPARGPSRRTRGSRASQSPHDDRTSPPSIWIRWMGAPFARVRDVARWVRDELEGLGVTGHLKTSGSRGLHIYLPMRPGTPFEAGLLFCRLIAVGGRGPPPRGGHGRARASSAGTRPPSISTACRTGSARRWRAPTARAPATSRACRRRSPGRSWTPASSTRATSRSARCRGGCATSAICGRACARRRGSIWTRRWSAPTSKHGPTVDDLRARAAPEKW